MFYKKITLIKNNKEIKKLVEQFTKEYWFAPQDVLLRSVEALIWAKRYFDKPILDIGTGNGSNSKYLFSKNQKIDVGIDIDNTGINLAKKTGMYHKVTVMDATRMMFKNSSFKTIISNSTFEHIKNDLLAVKEVSRVLKKNGLFCITVPTVTHEQILTNLGVNKVELEKYNDRVSHIHYRSINEWKNIFKKVNLKIIYHQLYFPKDVIKTWYTFHKIATFHIYKRELWSYMKDSPYGRLFPSFMIKSLLSNIIYRKVLRAFTGEGGMLFIVAKKTK